MKHIPASSLYILLHKADMSVLYEVWTQLRHAGWQLGAR